MTEPFVFPIYVTQLKHVKWPNLKAHNSAVTYGKLHILRCLEFTISWTTYYGYQTRERRNIQFMQTILCQTSFNIVPNLFTSRTCVFLPRVSIPNGDFQWWFNPYFLGPAWLVHNNRRQARLVNYNLRNRDFRIWRHDWTSVCID